MSDRIRETTRFEQQRDRLAALGKLSAGLAHELNNPASAAKRASSQLRDLLKRVRDASHELGKVRPDPNAKGRDRKTGGIAYANRALRHSIRLPPVISKISLTLCSAAMDRTICGNSLLTSRAEISGPKR